MTTAVEAAAPADEYPESGPTRIPLRVLLDEEWAVRENTHGEVVVLTSRADLGNVRQRAIRFLGNRLFRVERVAPRDVHEAVLASNGQVLDHEITNGFRTARPAHAARSGMARWQIRALIGAALAVVIVVMAGMGEWLLAAVTFFLAAINGLSLLAAWAHARSPRRADPPVPDEMLPTYTILIPAYKEEAVIGKMMRHIEELDYPKHLLDVIVLVEQHDPATEQAVLAANPPAEVRIVHIPPGTLQTKPRTCNLGLKLARGELLVIFDAEDRPEPDHLRRVAARFAASGPDLACVQARLKISNGRHNLLAGSFALEYATRWNLVMPGLIRLGLPIPLGGTSNHFRTELLRRLGGWDAWNVTEDADLGMRCAADGYRIDMVDAVTWEESVTDIGAWHKQRTRWHKGMLITTMVHTRNLVGTWRSFGGKGLLVLFSMVLGNPLASLLNSASWVLALLFMTGGLPTRFPDLAQVTGAVSLTSLAAGLVLHAIAGKRERIHRPWVLTLLLPLYGLAQTWAAAVAVVEAVRRPFHWNKTPHVGAA
jgi:glycosyltransferase involved in cell wall biosynthesis